jgi:hypothetical protein
MIVRHAAAVATRAIAAAGRLSPQAFPPPPLAAHVHTSTLPLPAVLQEFPNQLPMGVSSLLNTHLEPFYPTPGVYARGAHMRDMVQAQEKQTLGSST